MLGAIVGDIVGSVYEFDNIKTTEFALFADKSTFTDDTVMTLAVAKALLESFDGESVSQRALVDAMQEYGKLYPNAGYGRLFYGWLRSKAPEPYYSCGNGSAMRVSPVAWASDDEAIVEKLAYTSTWITHDHPEGIKGAQATAGCILLARKGSGKREIRAFAEERHGYDLGFTLDEIRPTYEHDETCQMTVPQALRAFLEGESFEEVIRLAISIGGDSDTIAAIAGSIAHAYYGIPDWIAEEASARLDDELRDTLNAFCERFHVM